MNEHLARIREHLQDIRSDLDQLERVLLSGEAAEEDADKEIKRARDALAEAYKPKGT